MSNLNATTASFGAKTIALAAGQTFIKYINNCRVYMLG